MGHYGLRVWVQHPKKKREAGPSCKSESIQGTRRPGPSLCVADCTQEQAKSKRSGDLCTPTQAVPGAALVPRVALHVHDVSFYFLQHHNVNEVEQGMFPQDIK